MPILSAHILCLNTFKYFAAVFIFAICVTIINSTLIASNNEKPPHCQKSKQHQPPFSEEENAFPNASDIQEYLNQAAIFELLSIKQSKNNYPQYPTTALGCNFSSLKAEPPDIL